MKKIFGILICILLITIIFPVEGPVEGNIFSQNINNKNENHYINCYITNQKQSINNLNSGDPLTVAITSPADGITVYDDYLMVVGYAQAYGSYEKIVGWESSWIWDTGRYDEPYESLTPASYYTFTVEVDGLYPGDNTVIVTFYNNVGSTASDSVTVTYVPPDSESPEVDIISPSDGATVQDAQVTLTGLITDNIGTISVGSRHEWEGDEAWTSGDITPTTYYPFEWIFDLHEGWNTITIYAYDSANNYGEDIIHLTYSTEDLTPPVTTINFGDPTYFKEENELLYITDETPITLIADDLQSGVDSTYYRIWDGEEWSSWTTYESPIYLTDDGYYGLEYYSEDFEGNTEETLYYYFIVDALEGLNLLEKWLNELTKQHVNDFAFLCISTNKNEAGTALSDDWITQGFYTYSILLRHGIPPDHIVVMIVDENIDLNKVYNNVNNSGMKENPAFSVRGCLTPWYLNSFKASALNQKDFNNWKTSLPEQTPEITSWLCYYQYLLGLYEEGVFKKKIIDFFADKKEKDKKMNVTFYLGDHGTQGSGDLLFPDSGQYPNHKLTPGNFWDDINMLEEELKDEHKIEWLKVVCLFDFCYSGYFVDALNLNEAANNNKIAVSSSAKDKKSPMISDGGLYTTIGSGFFNPFCKNLDAGKTIQQAFDEACKAVYKIQGQPDLKIIDRNPQIKGKQENKDFQPFWNDPIPLETEIHINSIDQIGVPVLVGDTENQIIPVGIKETKYRINGGQWKRYTDYITFPSEGTYILECYCVDNLGNEGEIISYQIIVDDTAPDSVNLEYPIDGDTDCSSTPSFDWSPVYDLSDVYYTLQISTDANFNNIVLEHERIMGSSFVIQDDESLSIGIYYWRVQAVDGVGHKSSWSSIWHFNILTENQAPDKPIKPTGPLEGKPNIMYEYSSTTTDNENDQLYYLFSWGDGSNSGWIGPYASGETVIQSHSWQEKGDYEIKVIAEDGHGHESEWSDTLSITMPRFRNINKIPILSYLENYPIIFRLLQLILNI